jgi:hypothetical protein
LRINPEFFISGLTGFVIVFGPFDRPLKPTTDNQQRTTNNNDDNDTNKKSKQQQQRCFEYLMDYWGFTKKCWLYYRNRSPEIELMNPDSKATYIRMT